MYVVGHMPWECGLHAIKWFCLSMVSGWLLSERWEVFGEFQTCPKTPKSNGQYNLC
jgi:hypothetical protein